MAQAYAAGLTARGLLAEPASGRYLLSGNVKRFDCDEIVHREANAEIEVLVSERATGRLVFGRTYTERNVEGSMLVAAVSGRGSVAELQSLAEMTLTEVVNKTLDDPAFTDIAGR